MEKTYCAHCNTSFGEAEELIMLAGRPYHRWHYQLFRIAAEIKAWREKKVVGRKVLIGGKKK